MISVDNSFDPMLGFAMIIFNYNSNSNAKRETNENKVNDHFQLTTTITTVENKTMIIFSYLSNNSTREPDDNKANSRNNNKTKQKT